MLHETTESWSRPLKIKEGFHPCIEIFAKQNTPGVPHCDRYDFAVFKCATMPCDISCTCNQGGSGLL